MKASEVVRSFLGDLFTIPQGETVESVLRVADFGPLETDGDAKVFGFTVGDRTFGGGGKVRLWYDPKTYAVRKRTYFLASRKTTITDIYDEYLINPDLPEDRFKLSEGPK